MNELNRCRVDINLKNLALNYKTLRQMTSPNALFMSVVKASGYGHGAVECAKALLDAGSEWFGLSNLEEVLELRRAEITNPMLILGYTPPTAARVLATHNITQTVYSIDYATELLARAERAGVMVDIHIKVDTGMSRLGFDPDCPGTMDCLKTLHASPHINITGTFTHFAIADCVGGGDDYTSRQFEHFLQFCDKMKQSGIPHGIRHCCNSAGILRHPDKHLDMVRGGIALYGLPPSSDCTDKATLLPVMSWQAAVSMVKAIPAGQKIGYGCTYTSPKAMRIATISAGYADGYDRAYSGRGRVLINGHFAPIVGRVCMDQFMVDVSDIPAKMGDMATLVGRDGEHSITFDELATLSGSINYELACRVSGRVERRWVR